MNRLETIVAELKFQIGEGVESALKYLEQHLNPDSPRFNDYIQIKGRYNSLQRELILGVLDQITYNQWRNNLSNALLLFADELTEEDLKSDPHNIDPTADKKGDILYFIPDQMLLNREEKCAVRVAWILESLLRDWNPRPEDVQKEIRMSDIMAVELLNLDQRNPFQIRSLSESVQFVDTDDFTEWIFYVKPLMEGSFSLVLRVSVIEMIRNKEYKKDIVLEEHVIVQTQDVPQQAPNNFKPANASLIMGNGTAEKRNAQAAAPAAATLPAAESSRPPSPAEEVQTVSKTAGKGLIRQIIFGLVATSTLVVAVMLGVPYYQEIQLWKKTRQCGEPSCAKAYLNQYPEGSHKEEALIMLADTLIAAPDSSAHSGGGQLPEAPAVDSIVIVDSVGDDFVLLPEDTVLFSLAEWEKKQAQGAKTKRSDSKKKPAPKSRTAAPQPPAASPNPVLPPQIAAPVKPSEKNTDVESGNTDLPGQVFYLKIKEFPIVQGGNNLLNIRFLKFNAFKTALVMLHNLNGSLFRPGQEIHFVMSDGKKYQTTVLYSAIDPDRGENSRISRAFFRLDYAALQAFAAEKVTLVRVTDPVSRSVEDYPTTKQTQRELNRRTKEVLDEMKKKAN